MGTRSRRRRFSLVITVLSLAALLALGVATTSVAATPKRPALAGAWSGKYGGAYAGTFQLHWKQTGSKLRGSITLSNPGGTYSVSGSLHGRKITFGAVGAGATYTGTWSGTKMSGRYKTAVGGGSWSARKRS